VKILLDTNAYTAFRGGNETVRAHIRGAEQVLFSAVVAGELLAGFRNGSRYESNARSLHLFLENPSVRLLDVTWRTADLFGQLSAALRQRGTPIPTNDIWIAAHLREADAILVSSDRHFRHIDGIEVLSFPVA
jgi:tRNA(fMet)-specific endonuclease VapC